MLLQKWFIPTRRAGQWFNAVNYYVEFYLKALICFAWLVFSFRYISISPVPVSAIANISDYDLF